MVLRVRKMISDHRKRLLPGLVALSLLAGIVVSIMSTPNAQADFYTGCGYGYSSSASGFGYGTGNAFGYGYGLTGVGGQTGVFGFGYGNQVCPPTTTTTIPGGGGGTTTTTTASTTTTVAPTTTTTRPPPPRKACRFHGMKFHGFAVVGRGMTRAITGACFYGQPKVTSNEVGTRVGVLHDNGRVLVVHVTVPAGSKPGWHTLTIREPNGKQSKVNYLVRIIPVASSARTIVEPK